MRASTGSASSDLSKLVRSTFKSFKVRDHGFAQMRQYIASLADIKVEKRGSDYFADARRIGSAPYAVRCIVRRIMCFHPVKSAVWGDNRSIQTLSPAAGFAMIARRKFA